MIPVYGFLEGDTLGLLVLTSAEETMEALANKLMSAADVRVLRPSGARVVFRGHVLEPTVTVAGAGIEPLDMFEVVSRGGGAQA